MPQNFLTACACLPVFPVTFQRVVHVPPAKRLWPHPRDARMTHECVQSRVEFGTGFRNDDRNAKGGYVTWYQTRISACHKATKSQGVENINGGIIMSGPVPSRLERNDKVKVKKRRKI